ncbi:MAG: DEAD/DEAH box helicase, partial [Saprospiraceae bacterium]
PKRQNLLFSATLPDIVEALMAEFFNDPLRIEASPVGTPLENIAQIQYRVPNFMTKLNLLEHLIADPEAFNKVLVFAATKQLADQLYEPLSEDYPGQVGVIHSNKDQNYRFNSVKSFQDGTYRILIATDVIARGIDISEVSHVINLDVPSIPEHYIHRIGRTGRADKKGIAITLVAPVEAEELTAIETLMQYEIPQLPIPEEVAIFRCAN